MRRRDFLYTAGGSLAAASITPALLEALARGVAPGSVDASQRGLLIILSSSASPGMFKVAHSLLEAATQHPLLRVMAGSAGARIASYDQLLKSDPTAIAYNHIILIGKPDEDPIQSAWQREATIGYGGKASDIYVFGYGHLRGDLGYIESDRNPFLHAANIPFAPYETEVITLSGTSDAGIAAASNAFLTHSLVNGIVAAPGWKRPETTLLDRDPLALTFALPTLAPPTLGGMTRIGVTQSSEDEYRGVLADTGVETAEMWRFKYFPANGWDIARSVGAFDAYAAGLHRRAYGNTLWLARFSDAGAAQGALPKIAAAAKIQQGGAQPSYAGGGYPGERASAGPLTLTQQGAWLMMRTF